MAYRRWRMVPFVLGTRVDLPRRPSCGSLYRRGMVRVREVMTERVVTVWPGDPIERQPGDPKGIMRAAELFWRLGYGAIPVVDQRYGLAGLISAADVIYALRRTPVHLRPMTVSGAMITDVMRGYPDWDVGLVAEKMKYLDVRVMPIVHHDGFLAGIVTRGDLLRRRRRPASSVLINPKRQTRRQTRTGPLARDVMTPADEIISVAEGDPANAAAAKLNSNTFTALPVLGPGPLNRPRRLLGLISEADLDWRGGGRTAGIVGQFMTEDLVTRPSGTRVSELARLLSPGELRVVPIVEGDLLVGLVSRSDLLHQLTIRYLRP